MGGNSPSQRFVTATPAHQTASTPSHMWRLPKRCNSLEEKQVVLLNGLLQSQTFIVLSLHRGVLVRPGLEDVRLFCSDYDVAASFDPLMS